MISWEKVAELAKKKFPRKRRTLLIAFLVLGAVSIVASFAVDFPKSVSSSDPKNIEALKNMFESVALLLGGWWFFKHEEYKQGFNLMCRASYLNGHQAIGLPKFNLRLKTTVVLNTDFVI